MTRCNADCPGAAGAAAPAQRTAGRHSVGLVLHPQRDSGEAVDEVLALGSCLWAVVLREGSPGHGCRQLRALGLAERDRLSVAGIPANRDDARLGHHLL